MFFQKLSPISRIVPKTQRSPLYSQNNLFLVKIEGGFDENKLEKKLHSTEKNSRLLKTKIGYSAIFSNLRFLLSETQYTSDKTSELRI